jgi:uncharacterized protein YycO
MKIGLYRHTGLIPCAIKWQTRSEYSHGAILFSDGVLIEATWPKVQRVVNPAPDHKVDWFEIAGLTEDQERTIRCFCESQVGKPYDLTMVVRFVTRRQESRKSTGKWFCSELVFAACQKAGIDLLSRIEPWAVSPELLSLSPLLLPEHP